MKLLSIVPFLLITTIAHAQSVDIELLQQVVCDWETRGVKDPDESISSAGAVGACQIKEGTARAVGYRGKISTLLTDGWVNRRVALEILSDCHQRGRRGVYELAYCYHGGPRAKISLAKHRVYAKTIMILYAERVRDRQWR